MPLYDYECSECGISEAWRGVETSSIPCPHCGKPAERRPYSGVPYSNTETGGDFLPGEPMREK